MTNFNYHKIINMAENNNLLRKMLTGVGFMADAYDLFVINVVVHIMEDIYPASPTEETLVKLAALIGSVIGQIIFGYYADKIGRKWMFVTSCSLTIFGSLASACVGNFTSIGIYGWLTLTRFILGIGVGAEYPLSATITAENSTQGGDESKNLATTFSMQGVGQILSGIVLIITTHCIEDKQIQWRLALAFGALPMMCSFYYRWNMAETEIYENRHDNNGTEINNPVNNRQNNENKSMTSEQSLNTEFLPRLSIWECVKQNWIQVLGTSGSWFLLDIVFYANSLFSGSITEAMGTADGNKSMAVQVFILQCISFPGYLASIKWIDTIGCRNLQLYGFGIITFIFLLMAILQGYLEKVGPLYIIIYGLTFFFENFGPNCTTYVIPAITYPTNSRATCHGISAACGKMGAIFGVVVLLYMKNGFCSGECDDDDPHGDINKGLQLTFGFCSFIGIIGWLWTYFLVSDKLHSSLNQYNNNNNI